MTRRGKWYYKTKKGGYDHLEQFLLQSGTTFIPKWGKKLLTVQIANERNRGNRFWQPTPLFTSNYLAKDTGERG